MIRHLLSRYRPQQTVRNAVLNPGYCYSWQSVGRLKPLLVGSNYSCFQSYFSGGKIKASDGQMEKRTYMKGLVYTGENNCEVRECPMPDVQSPTDAVVQMIHTSICGTDLHILKGDVPTVEKGRVLGHEGVGAITSLGSAVGNFFVGDIVLISCISTCGICHFCRRGLNSHCANGGWILGNVIDGTQAEYVRIPHANASLHKLPGNIDSRAMVALSDAFPTGMECGTLNANVQPGSSVAIVGAGPVGLAAMLTAKLYSPSIVVVVDVNDARLEHARGLGADMTINPKAPEAMEALDTAVKGQGFDSVIEAVGTPSTFELCQKLVGPGGSLANIGVHGQKATIFLDELWDRNISIKTRLVDTVTLPMLLRLCQTGQLKPELITHHYQFSDILEAYRKFQSASEEGILKVAIDF